jgi:hypothetical protein
MAGKLDSADGNPMTAAEPVGDYVLEALNIWKRYGGTQAVAPDRGVLRIGGREVKPVTRWRAPGTEWAPYTRS